MGVQARRCNAPASLRSPSPLRPTTHLPSAPAAGASGCPAAASGSGSSSDGPHCSTVKQGVATPASLPAAAAWDEGAGAEDAAGVGAGWAAAGGGEGLSSALRRAERTARLSVSVPTWVVVQRRRAAYG